MAFCTGMVSHIDKEKAEKSIAVILDKIKTDADPVVLNEYRSIIKKEIPFFRRSWAAAYLLMLFDRQNRNGFHGNHDRPGRDRRPRQDQDSGSRSGKQQENRPSRVQKPGMGGENAEEGRVHQPGQARQYPLADEDSKRIFISIGRNRRVFPREILGLIISKTGASRDDIGAIRILENYSFVQVRDTIAEKIIEVLNGCVFRGRTLTVNFAKTRSQNPDDQDAGQYPVHEDAEDPGIREHDEALSGYPEAEYPETDTPETDAPETDNPETDIPETENPETDIPESNGTDLTGDDPSGQDKNQD
ncbi:MAG: DbpA RNA binding domain-containing protein [Treponema sp.]|nr:DbpA RNA binding domain-containing protein [Treponema sp.]